MSGSATLDSTETMTRFDKTRIWDVVCGGLLIVAASLQVLYPTASGIAGTHGDALPWGGTTLAVGRELLLGWGLVAGVGPKSLRPAAGILFTLFAV